MSSSGDLRDYETLINLEVAIYILYSRIYNIYVVICFYILMLHYLHKHSHTSLQKLLPLIVLRQAKRSKNCVFRNSMFVHVKVFSLVKVIETPPNVHAL